MGQPRPYGRTKNFTENLGSETDHSALNAELDAAGNSINDIRTNIAILQADDGKLRPAVVTPDSISAELRASLVAGVTADTVALRDAAQTSANASAASATNSANSANSAAASATTATTKAGDASTSANNAANSAANAASSVSAAGLPSSLAGQALNWLRVKANELGYELRTSIQHLADIGAIAKAGDSLAGALNEARATVVGNATTTDIWGATSTGTIAMTGTPIVTTFPAAPQAGAKRRLYPAAGTIFVNSATLDIVGGVDFTVATGNFVDVEAITTTTFKLIPPANIQATETARGTAQVATQAKTDAGVIDTDMVTPKKLRNGFAMSLTTNGYIKLTSWLGGLIFQWGQIASASYATGTNTTLTVTHPVTFPVDVGWSCMFQGTKNLGNAMILSGTTTTTGIDANINNSSGLTITTMIRWFSIGW